MSLSIWHPQWPGVSDKGLIQKIKSGRATSEDDAAFRSLWWGVSPALRQELSEFIIRHDFHWAFDLLWSEEAVDWSYPPHTKPHHTLWKLAKGRAPYPFIRASLQRFPELEPGSAGQFLKATRPRLDDSQSFDHLGKLFGDRPSEPYWTRKHLVQVEEIHETCAVAFSLRKRGAKHQSVIRFGNLLHSVLPSPDGRWLVTHCNEPPAIAVFREGADAEFHLAFCRETSPRYFATSAHFSPDSLQLVYSDGLSLHFLSLEEGKLLTSVPQGERDLLVAWTEKGILVEDSRGIGFHHDKNRIPSGFEPAVQVSEGRLVFFNWKRLLITSAMLDIEGEFTLPNDCRHPLKVSPSGQSFAWYSGDTWYLGDWSGAYQALDGEFLTFARADIPVHWSQNSLHLGLHSLPFPSEKKPWETRVAAVSSDGMLAALAVGSDLTLWDVETQECYERRTLDFRILGMSLSPLEDKLWVGGKATDGRDNKALIFELDYEQPKGYQSQALKIFRSWRRGDHGKKFEESLF